MSVFIGFDHRQPIAYNVAQYSIIKHASGPVSITPLVLKTLPLTKQGLTPFTFSRFLVPWICGYEGTAIFMDSDFMCRADIHDLPKPGNPVSVVKNERRFEWPSLMVFDCAQCKKLTPEYVQNASNKELFGLTWASSVGSLPPEWNHLVGYDPPNPDAKLVHFTKGLPCFPEIQGADREHGDEWMAYAQEVVSTASWATLMGNSVHADQLQTRRISGR